MRRSAVADVPQKLNEMIKSMKTFDQLSNSIRMDFSLQCSLLLFLGKE